MFFVSEQLPPPRPRRIVSLVPSQTELLCDLGLEEETVGITKFCVHPDRWFRHKARVGGTKTIDPDKVRALAPDLILANKEENVKEQVEALSDIAPVWVSDISTLEDALLMINEIGRLTGKEEKAHIIAGNIARDFAALLPEDTRKALYLIWRKPWMTVGRDTFIHDMLRHCGLDNIYGEEERYPELTFEYREGCQPELILLSSEPYPFKEQHIAECRRWFPQASILLADGEMFSWYGSRLLQAPAYFRQLLSPHIRFQK